MLLGHVTHPARYYLHRTVLEGVVKDVLLHAGMGIRGGREGGKQRGREGAIKRQEEVLNRERSGGGGKQSCSLCLQDLQDGTEDGSSCDCSRVWLI